MRNTKTFRALLRLLRAVILLDIFIFLAVGIFAIFSGWQTVSEYGNALSIAGMGGLIFVLVLGMGWSHAGTEDFAALSKAGAMRPDELIYVSNRENDTRVRFMLTGIIALAIAIASGFVLKAIP